MNLKTVMPLGLAIVLGLIAAFVAKNTLSKRNANPEAASQVKILSARKDIPPGKQLTPEDVATTAIAGSTAPANAFTDASQLSSRVAGTAGIVQGQPITEAVLAPLGTGSGLQSLIPAGMRAVTIDINETTGLAGMLQPGCMVDVLTTLRTNKGDTSIAKTIVQNVKVTAVGSRVNPNPTPEQQDQGPARSVTLLVTPKDAETIELAASVARPRLVLRSNKDGAPVSNEGITLIELVGDPSFNKDPFVETAEYEHMTPTTQPVEIKPVVETRQEQSETFRTVTVIRGGVESTVKFRVPRAVRGEMTGTDTQEIN